MMQTVSIEGLLRKGPMHSADLVERIRVQAKITDGAARKRLERELKRSGSKVTRVEHLQLERKACVYCLGRQQPLHAKALLNAFYNQGRSSKYARVLMTLRSSGWVSTFDHLAVRSGVRVESQKSLTLAKILEDLVAIGCIKKMATDIGEVFHALELDVTLLASAVEAFEQQRELEEQLHFRVDRHLTKNRFISANSSRRRSLTGKQAEVAGYAWDVTGPSYLLPFKGEKGRAPTFVVCDAFLGHVGAAEFSAFRYKAESAVSAGVKVLPILVAKSFSKPVLTHANDQGWMAVIIGEFLGAGFAKTLKGIDEIQQGKVTDADDLLRVATLTSDSATEGALTNLRGIVFELLALHNLLMRGARDFMWGKKITVEGEKREIDVLVTKDASVIFIECKSSKNPVSAEEVIYWIKRSVPVQRKWALSQEGHRDLKHVFRFLAANGFEQMPPRERKLKFLDSTRWTSERILKEIDDYFTTARDRALFGLPAHEDESQVKSTLPKKSNLEFEFETGEDLQRELRALNKKQAVDILKLHFLDKKKALHRPVE